MTFEPHIKEMALRRFWTGELAAPEKPAIEAHTAACPRCRARLKEMGDEQRRFEQEISFDRFAAGVERAARTPRRVPAPARGLSLGGPTMRWFFPLASVAAAVALTFTVAPRLRSGEDAPIDRALSRLKGGSGITVQIAPAGRGPQRTAAVSAPETLSPGERLRIGYQPGTHRYVTALSIDDQGEVSPIYPETGHSLPVSRAKGPIGSTQYLPDSIELTGKGSERVIVILSDQPLEVEAVKQAALTAFQRAGDLARLAPLELPGEQFQRTFVKP
jgi:hypothetical protein